MIKLQDFAKQQGVTDRAIQKHLKTYAEELEGLYQRKGPNGTWLTDEACEILRSKMKQAPITVITPSEQEEDLRDRIRDLEHKLFETQQKFTDYVSSATPLLQKASEQVALAERAEEYKERIGTLEAQNRFLSVEKEEASAKATEAEKNAEKAYQELQDALKQFEEEKRMLEKQIVDMKEAGFWRRVRGWKNSKE